MYKFNKLNKFYLLINVFFKKFHSAFRNRTLIIIILIFTTFMMNYFLAKFNTNSNTNLQRCLQRRVYNNRNKYFYLMDQNFPIEYFHIIIFCYDFWFKTDT